MATNNSNADASNDTLRNRAITLRERWIRHEERSIPNYRGDQEWSAQQHRDYGRGQIKRWRAAVAMLESLPEDMSDTDVRGRIEAHNKKNERSGPAGLAARFKLTR